MKGDAAFRSGDENDASFHDARDECRGRRWLSGHLEITVIPSLEGELMAAAGKKYKA